MDVFNHFFRSILHAFCSQFVWINMDFSYRFMAEIYQNEERTKI